MSVLYNLNKANVVADTLCLMTMDSVSHIKEGKKYLVKDVHRLSRLGDRLVSSPNGACMVHNNYE